MATIKWGCVRDKLIVVGKQFRAETCKVLNTYNLKEANCYASHSCPSLRTWTFQVRSDRHLFWLWLWFWCVANGVCVSADDHRPMAKLKLFNLCNSVTRLSLRPANSNYLLCTKFDEAQVSCLDLPNCNRKPSKQPLFLTSIPLSPAFACLSHMQRHNKYTPSRNKLYTHFFS